MKAASIQNRIPIETLEFDGLSLFDEDQEALIQDVNLQFPKGQVIHLKGPSGCGKSTMLSVIAGTNLTYQGRYLINSKDIRDLPWQQIVPYRLNFGYAFEKGGLISTLTLKENLILPLKHHNLMSGEDLNRHVDTLLELFNLGKFSHKIPSKVSAGARKSASIARSVILSPQVLLLDDPIAELSEEGIDALEYLLVDWSILKSEEEPIIILTGKNHPFLRRWVDIEVEFVQNENSGYTLRSQKVHKIKDL